MRLKITKSEKDKFFFLQGMSVIRSILLCALMPSIHRILLKKNNTLSPNTENAYLLQGCVFATNTFS